MAIAKVAAIRAAGAHLHPSLERVDVADDEPDE